ncbi:27379_t:CDS:2, partial [Racocetra persica]
EMTLVEELTQSNISLIVEQFTFNDKDLNVIIEQNTPFNIQMMKDFLIAFNLPISPAFGIFTATVQDPSTTDSEMTYFHLKRDVYDAKNLGSIEVSNIKKSVCIAAEIIEWSYLSQVFSKSGADVPLIKNRRTRHKKLEKLAKKLNPTNKVTRKGKHLNSKNAQEESSSRAIKLKNVAN